MVRKQNPRPGSGFPPVLSITILLAARLAGLPGDLYAAQIAEPPGFEWIGPDGGALPFQTPDDVERFLSRARVVQMKTIPTGITHPKKMLLELGGVRMHAVFRNVNVHHQRWRTPEGHLKLDFQDNYRYELAAYRLARLLGIHNVPPVVERSFTPKDFKDSKWYHQLGDRTGSLQAWVENAMTEKDRRSRNLQPPNLVRWSHQMQLMYIFDNLIFNEDRNQGNILIGPGWKIWFIDATRAFRPYHDLKQPSLVLKVDRDLYQHMKGLGREDFASALGSILSERLIRCLYARYQELIGRIEQLIQEKGEERVLADFRLG